VSLPGIRRQENKKTGRQEDRLDLLVFLSSCFLLNGPRHHNHPVRVAVPRPAGDQGETGIGGGGDGLGIGGALGGALAFVFRLILESFFGQQWNMATSGIVVPGPEPLVLFARTSCNVSDESALKHCWQVKGASGTRPCLFFAKIVSSVSRPPFDQQLL
jgi:hypothetical protein